jgi:DNA-directed RNA polymerase subunit K/omega
LKDYGEIDSKFRYIILASKRAKQLLKGAKPKIKSKSRNLIRVAQQEVKMGLIEFEIIQNPVEEFIDSGDDMFIGEEIRAAEAAREDEPVAVEEDSKEPEVETQTTGQKLMKAAQKASAEKEKEDKKKGKKPAPKKKTKKE